MRFVAIAVVASSSLASFPLTARAAAPEGRRATVEVDTSDVGDAGPIIHRRVEERADVVLRDAEVLPGAAPEDPVIRVTVHELVGEEPGFSFELRIERAGREVGSRRRIECNLCTETEIVAKVESEIAAAVADLPDEPEPAPEPEFDPQPGPSEAFVTEPVRDDDTDDDGLGAKGKAGVALLATGVVGLGVGIGLSIPGWKPVSGDPTRERSTRPIGLGLVGAGGAVLLTGAILLGLDRRERNSRRPRAAVRVGPRGAFVGVTGRF